MPTRPKSRPAAPRAATSPATRRGAGVGGRLISKSKFLWGSQCPKLLWHAYHAKELITPPDASTQGVFDQGHLVGALSRRLFPDGIEIGPGVVDLDETLRLTAEHLPLRRPLFEAAFAANGGYCRVDILVPAPRGAWDLIEVKSTSETEPVHLTDLAFQAWVLRQAGLTLRRASLCRINPEFIRQGEVDPEKFFVVEPLTSQVEELGPTTEKQLDAMKRVLQGSATPEPGIGPHCDSPYPCPMQAHCWAHLPKHSVMDLYRGRKKGFELLQSGIRALGKVPDDVKLTDRQQIQRTAVQTARAQVNSTPLRSFLKSLEYPVRYLDFETFATAIPLFDGLRPFQQVPFQFSLHEQTAPGGPLQSVQFLADGPGDPRPAFLDQLREAVGARGSILTYNAAFEVGRLEECAEAFPAHQGWIRKATSRVVDLLVPFRAFDYYHPEQQGSASMKAVLPALTGKGYEGLGIQEGGTASREYLRVTHGEATAADRAQVRAQLAEYCGRDTEGMAWMVDALWKLVKPR